MLCEGPVNSFLSWKAFIPLSRLTYCAYLIHPLVIWWLLVNNETMMHFSIHLMIMMFLSKSRYFSAVFHVFIISIRFVKAGCVLKFQIRR